MVLKSGKGLYNQEITDARDTLIYAVKMVGIQGFMFTGSLMIKQLNYIVPYPNEEIFNIKPAVGDVLDFMIMVFILILTFSCYLAVISFIRYIAVVLKYH